MTDDVRKGEQPFDRLTALCDVMGKALEKAVQEESGEHSPVRAIIFLENNSDAGIEMYGYEDANEGLAALMIHIRALFQAQDRRLEYGVMTPQGLMILGMS